MPSLSLIIPLPSSPAREPLERLIDSLTIQEASFEAIFLIESQDVDAPGMKLVRSKVGHDPRFKAVLDLHGPAGQRLEGVKLAKGDYIYFVDGDDYLEPGALKTMLEEIGSHDVLLFNYYVTKNGKSTKNRLYTTGVFGRKQAIKLLLGDFKVRSFMWCKLFKRSLFAGRFLTLPDTLGKSHGEDIMMVVSLFERANSFKAISKPLYHYRKDIVSSCSERPRQDRARGHLFVYEAVGAYLSDLYPEHYELFLNKLPRIKLSLQYDLRRDKKYYEGNFKDYRDAILEELASIKKKGPLGKGNLFSLDLEDCLVDL